MFETWGASVDDDGVLDVVARAAALTTAAVDAATADGSPSARRELLASMDRAIAVLTSLRGRVLTAEKADGGWAGSGDRSFEAWRARTSRTGQHTAGAELRQAEALEVMSPTRQALHEGAITTEHVTALARLTSSDSATVREAAVSDQGQAELLAMASREDAAAFARSVRRWAARKEPASLERSHQRQRAERYLHVVPAPDGVRVKGLLDDQAGHRLRLALEAVSPRPALGDDRSPEQRRADALDVIASKVLELPETGRGAAVRPHVSLLMDAATWADLRAARQAGVPTAAVPSTEPVTLEDGTPVPMTEVARALCDCELTRIVVDADGVPVDLGRTDRVYRNEQRRAVIARDRECAWPDCHAHARWGEVHHIRWWDRDDGPTSVENGVLLCRFHHQEVHRQDLSITRRAATGGDVGRPRAHYDFRAPDGRRISGSPARAAQADRSPARAPTPAAPTRAAPTPAASTGRTPTGGLRERATLDFDLPLDQERCA